jgi:DNA-binding CsgD family transcriptional regulator
MVSSPFALDLLDFLLTRPNSDQIAQHLVLRLMGSHHTRAAVISVFAPDATLNEVGMFGLGPSALDVYRCLTLEDITPMTDAVRTGEPVIVTTEEELQARYPWMLSPKIPFEPLAVWPLVLPDEYVGSIEFIFTVPPDVEVLRVQVGGIAVVLALYLSMLRDSAFELGHPWAPPDKETATFPATPDLRLVPSAGEPLPPERSEASGRSRRQLSSRQVDILVLMSRGFTNAQISCHIGFSESTVAQETLEIFRYFNVHSRHEAVRAAGRRGLIGSASD